MAKQLKKFCRITKYIEKTDPKLHEILDDLCVLGSFRPRRGHNGITFILPSKETVAKLDKMRFSEDIDKGCDIVLAHIIHDFLPNAAAWNTKKSDIPNALNKKIEVKEVKGSKIILADGAELEQDAKFRTFSRGDENQAVYEIKKGSLDPMKHIKTATFEHARQAVSTSFKRPPPMRGGASVKCAQEVLCAFACTQAEAVITGVPCDEKWFGFLVDLHTVVQREGSDAEKAYLGVMMSPLPMSTLAFVLSEEYGNPLKDYVDKVKGEGKGLYGMKSYLAAVDKSHADFHKFIRGGARSDDFEVALTAVIAKAIERSDTEIAKFEPLAGGPLTGKLLANLNMARKLEHETYLECSRNKINSESAHDDIRAMFKECAGILCDRTTGSCTDTNAKSTNLGAFIVGLLSQVNKFLTSDYAIYPFDKSCAKKADCESSALVCRYNKDVSAHAVFSSISAECMAEFFGQISAEPTGVVEETPLDE